MSRASKISLAATSLFALSTIGIVHFQQKAERSVSSHLSSGRRHPCHYPGWTVKSIRGSARRLMILTASQAMHEGVIRDMEQLRQKKERQLDFDLQRAMEAEYLKNQTVKSTTNEGDGGAPAPAPVVAGEGAGGSGSEGTKA